MADKNLDRKLRLVNELIILWQELQVEMDAALEAPAVDDEMEDRCMATKTKIAQRKQLAVELMGQDFSSGGGIVSVLLGIPTLDLFKRQSPIVISNLRNVWHDTFIALNQLAGNLKIQAQEEGKGGSQKKSGGIFGKIFGRG
jgi:hypothetical protein